MKINRLVTVIGIATGLLLGGCTGGGDILMTGKTAKTAYKIALVEAKKRSSDAAAVDIYANVDNKGESSSWNVEFYSAAANQKFKLIIKEGKLAETREEKVSQNNSVGENWVDSNQIMDRALKECGQVVEDKYFASLDNSKKLQWKVNCQVGEDKSLYVVFDGATGEFIETRQAGIGW